MKNMTILKNVLIIFAFLILIAGSVAILAVQMIAPWKQPAGPGTSGSDWLFFYEWFWMCTIPVVIGEIGLCVNTMYYTSSKENHKIFKTVFHIIATVLAIAMIVLSYTAAFEISTFIDPSRAFLWSVQIAILYLLGAFAYGIVLIIHKIISRKK